MNRTFRLHLVLGSIGETTHNLARACLVRFENLEVNTLEHYQIQNKARVDYVLAAIEECPGAVTYTMLNEKISADLEQVGSSLSVLCINVLGGIIPKLKSFFGQKIKRQPGRQHQMGAGYFDRIEAMQLSPSLDDEQSPQALKEAKTILVGEPLPPELFLNNVGLVVGPTTSPKRLVKFSVTGCWS